MSDPTAWALIATAFFTLLTAVGALRSARLTYKASQATIVNTLHSEYASEKVGDAVARLYQFRHKHGHNVWLDRYVERWKERSKDPKGEVAAIEPGRRILEHWYYQLDHMLAVGSINEEFIRKLMTPTQVKLLEELIYPINQKLPDPSDSFRRIFKALHREAPRV